MTNRFARTVLAAAAGLLCGALPAAAQQAAGGSPANPGVRSVDFDVIGELLYNTNVADSDAALAAARGIPSLDDEVFTPSVALNVNLPIGREALFLQSSAGYDFYRTDTILNRERINVLGGITGPTGPCRETLTGGYTRNQTDVADLTDLAQPEVRNVESHESVAMDASCGRAIGLTPTVSLSQAWDDNSALERQIVDYHSFSATGALAYQRPALGAISLFGNFVTTTYPNQVDFFSPVTGGYNVYAGGLKYDRHLGARIQGMVSLSYTSLQPAISGTPGFSGFTYSGDLTYQASGRLEAHLSADRATVPSVSVDSSFSVNEEYQAEAIYEVGPRLKLQLGVSSLHKAFSQSPLFFLTSVSDETTYDVYGTATYTLNRRLSLILDLRREQRDANIAEFNYVGTRVGLTARGTF